MVIDPRRIDSASPFITTAELSGIDHSMPLQFGQSGRRTRRQALPTRQPCDGLALLAVLHFLELRIDHVAFAALAARLRSSGAARLSGGFVLSVHALAQFLRK